MHFTQTTPILRILDEAQALAFYVQFLGFEVDWTHRFAAGLPLYLQVSRGDCVLHLTEHHGDASPGAAVRIQTDNIEGFHAELLARHGAAARPTLDQMPWGSRDVSVKDPFGNRLTFTDAIST